MPSEANATYARQRPPWSSTASARPDTTTTRLGPSEESVTTKKCTAGKTYNCSANATTKRKPAPSSTPKKTFGARTSDGTLPPV